MTSDVVIIGGGLMGLSTAYHLFADAFRGRVIVIERDPTYARASSALALGGIRQQFSSALNVRLAQYSIEFYKRFDDIIRAGHADRAGFVQRGYLFLVDAGRRDRFERRYETQRRLGARIELLSRDAIRTLVPDLMLDDIEFGILGPDDGYASPRAVLAGFHHAAAQAGADILSDDVIDIRCAGGRTAGVTLASGARIDSPLVVNAAGPYAGRVAALARVAVPVEPVRQQLFRCALPHYWPYRFPVVIDPDGVHWRHEDAADSADRDRIVVAKTALDEPPGENFDCDVDRWNREFRPALVRRLPAFERLELIEGWAGLYEMTPDHNPLLGEHPDLPGLLIVAGFSGHGFMMTPAAGKAMSELIRLGRCDTFDIHPFRPSRFHENDLAWDEAMI